MLRSSPMLISRSELSHDFDGAKFDSGQEEDRKFLAWVFNQFLYGEVTGIQCGHWLFRAPRLSAATFLARQAGEELSHVKRMLRILEILGSKPEPAHRAVQFLSTGMMGGSWGEHVALEMALGEGLVLAVFYALADTVDQPEIRKILESAVLDEEKHVMFGEKETREWVQEHPRDRKLLLGLAVVQFWGLKWLAGFVSKRMVASFSPSHPVLGQFDAFFTKVLLGFKMRIERLGLSDRPLDHLGRLETLVLVVALPFRKVRSHWSARRAPLLTSTYLEDPWLNAPDPGTTDSSVRIKSEAQ